MVQEIWTKLEATSISLVHDSVFTEKSTFLRERTRTENCTEAML